MDDHIIPKQNFGYDYDCKCLKKNKKKEGKTKWDTKWTKWKQQTPN